MPLRFINLTYFEVRIWTNEKKSKETVFPASGIVAKIKFTERIASLSEMVELKVLDASRLEGLPEEADPELRYIVPESVFRWVDDRKDLTFPFGAIRHEGKVMAHRFLACHPKKEVERYYAGLGFFTNGIHLVKPVQCIRCRKWDEETGMGIVVEPRNGKPVIACPSCMLKYDKESKRTQHVGG